MKIPDPHALFANEYLTSCFIQNVVQAKNVQIGDYTYYDDEDAIHFEKNNILFNYPEFGDRLIIGKFCSIASGTQFIMGSANHRINSVSTYPFAVMGGEWAKRVPEHLSQLPFKGDIVIGNDVWFGRHCVIMPGVHIGDGAIIAAESVVTKDVEPYTVVGGHPARLIRKRFDDEMIALLLKWEWWKIPPEELVEALPILCDFDLKKVKSYIRASLSTKE